MDIQIKLTNNGDEISFGVYQFKSLAINYGINSFPGFTLILSKIQSDDQVMNWTKYDFLSFKDLHVNIKSPLFNFESDLGVNNVFSKTLNTIVVQGLLCKSDLMSTVKSQYLGKEVKESIKALGFNQDLTLSNIQYDYFQLNESAVNCLHKILTQNSQKSVYAITEDEIKVIKLESLIKTNSILLPTNIESIQYDPQFHIANNPTDISFEVYNEEVGGKKYKLGMASQYNWIAAKDNYSPVTLNMISNLIFMEGLNYSLITTPTVAMNGDKKNFQIGDIVTLPYSDLPIKNYMITGVNRTLNLSEVSSVYTLQNVE